ncbi:retrotransposon protein, putative, ty1-copia subclass [Tanacetum coccineum]
MVIDSMGLGVEQPLHKHLVYALETAAHILNLVPTKKVSKTPFEMWKGKRPSLGHIKIWGCEVFVRREAQDKLEARSEKCLFVGYPKESFGYLFYKPKDNVVFSVDEEPIVNTDSQQEVVTPVEPNDVSLPIRRTSRVSKPPQDPQFYYGFHIEEDKISDSTLSELDEPANYKEAMASPEAAKWKEAMKSEIQSMYDNQVWNLVDTTTGLKTVGLTDEELDKMSRVPYASAIGSIMYAMTCTRPDVSFCSEHGESTSAESWRRSLDSFALTKEPKDHGKSKHIDRKYHFVRSKVAEGHVQQYTVEQRKIDSLIKGLSTKYDSGQYQAVALGWHSRVADRDNILRLDQSSKVEFLFRESPSVKPLREIIRKNCFAGLNHNEVLPVFAIGADLNTFDKSSVYYYAVTHSN